MPRTSLGRRLALSLSQLWAFVAVALPAMAVTGRLSTVDLAYQIRTGQQILRSHGIPRVDFLTFTAAGRPWVNQQWGAQVLLDVVYRAGHWGGLALLRVGTVAVTFSLVYLACRGTGVLRRQAAWLTLAAVPVTLGGLALRPQLFGMALFALALWLVAGRRRHPARLWAMPVVAALWANVHGSFVLAPLVLALAWLEDRREDRAAAGRTLLVLVATSAATLINPFGPAVWTYAIGLARNTEVARFVSEWQPPTIHTFVGATFFASVFAVLVFLARRGRSAPWTTLLWLAPFLAMALQATRGVFWWGLVAPVVLAGMLGKEGEGVGEGRHRAEPERSELGPTLLHTLIAAMLAAAGVLVFPWWGRASTEPSERLLAPAPVGITMTVAASLRSGGRMFNAQRWGSWFELALPSHPVFVDSRVEVIPASVWSDYQAVSSGRQGWQAILDHWRIDLVVLDRQEQAGLLPLIRRDSGWRLIRADGDGLVFERARSPSPP